MRWCHHARRIATPAAEGRAPFATYHPCPAPTRRASRCRCPHRSRRPKGRERRMPLKLSLGSKQTKKAMRTSSIERRRRRQPEGREYHIPMELSWARSRASEHASSDRSVERSRRQHGVRGTSPKRSSAAKEPTGGSHMFGGWVGKVVLWMEGPGCGHGDDVAPPKVRRH